MIRVPVKTKNGVYRVMRTRVPRTRTFDLYRKAEAVAPELLKQIYTVISRDVQARATETVHRSTVLFDQIPSNWPYRKQWLKVADSEAQRRSLFEQVLWTYFFDRQELWETTWPDKGRTGAEYVGVGVKPSEAREARPRPKGARGVAPKAASRGIGPAPTARPATRSTEAFGPGDIVIFVKGEYKGLRGEVMELEYDGPFVRAIVRLPGGAQYEKVFAEFEELAKLN